MNKNAKNVVLDIWNVAIYALFGGKFSKFWKCACVKKLTNILMHDSWFLASQPFTLTWQQVHFPLQYQSKHDTCRGQKKQPKPVFHLLATMKLATDSNSMLLPLGNVHTLLHFELFLFTQIQARWFDKLQCNGYLLDFHQQKGWANWVDLRWLADNNSFATDQTIRYPIHPLPLSPRWFDGSCNQTATENLTLTL